MQPTDPQSQVGFRVFVDAKAARRIKRDSRAGRKGLVTLRTASKGSIMKARVIRLLMVVTTVAATALAGGASLQGF